MAKYQVLGGKHYNSNGSVSHKGDIIESDEDLVGKFPNKFKRLAMYPAGTGEEQEAPATPKKPAISRGNVDNG